MGSQRVLDYLGGLPRPQEWTGDDQIEVKVQRKDRRCYLLDLFHTFRTERALTIVALPLVFLSRFTVSEEVKLHGAPPRIGLDSPAGYQASLL